MNKNGEAILHLIISLIGNPSLFGNGLGAEIHPLLFVKLK
jgi:hypothetical protein